MFNKHRISSSENLAAGKNVSLHQCGKKIIIDVDTVNTTVMKHGDHWIEGKFIEIESGEGIIINTSSPNKIKISFDAYAIFGDLLKLDKLEFIKSIEARLLKLEKGV